LNIVAAEKARAQRRTQNKGPRRGRPIFIATSLGIPV
jgi:hypothetical protein